MAFGSNKTLLFQLKGFEYFTLNGTEPKYVAPLTLHYVWTPLGIMQPGYRYITQVHEADSYQRLMSGLQQFNEDCGPVRLEVL